MKRLAALLLLAPLAVLGTASPAEAAPLCQGQVPTIVGEPGRTVTGTPGDDVIVTEGAHPVDAGDGNDRICVTGSALAHPEDRVRVVAGAGADTVDTTAYTSGVEAALGTGVDAFVGGPGSDRVDTVDSDGTGETVSTSSGDDDVFVGRSGEPVNDLVDLGEGNDYLRLQGLPGAGSMDGGAGSDYLWMWDVSRADWRIDNRERTLTVGSVTMPLLGVESFDGRTLRWASLVFVGGAEQEGLSLSSSPTQPNGGAVVDMGGGDDGLIVGPAPLSGPYHGGAGADRLAIQGQVSGPKTKGAVSADLVAGLIRIGTGDQAKATSWTDVYLSDFDRNLVRTGTGSQRIVIAGCRGTVHAGSGDDVVLREPWLPSCGGPVSTRALTAYGEGGDDTLVGAGGNDLLVGGPGKDTAKGRHGRDVCSAEVRISCEG